MNVVMYVLVIAIIVVAMVGGIVVSRRAVNAPDTSVVRSSVGMLLLVAFVLVVTIGFGFFVLPGMNL